MKGSKPPVNCTSAGPPNPETAWLVVAPYSQETFFMEVMQDLPQNPMVPRDFTRALSGLLSLLSWIIKPICNATPLAVSRHMVDESEAVCFYWRIFFPTL